MTARHTSALSYAHKNSVFEQTDRVTESLMRMGQLQQGNPQFEEFLDFKGQAGVLIRGADQLDYLLDEQEAEQNKQRRMEMQETEADRMRQEAAGAALNNAKMAGEAEGLLPQQGGQPV